MFLLITFFFFFLLLCQHTHTYKFWGLTSNYCAGQLCRLRSLLLSSSGRKFCSQYYWLCVKQGGTSFFSPIVFFFCFFFFLQCTNPKKMFWFSMISWFFSVVDFPFPMWRLSAALRSWLWRFWELCFVFSLSFFIYICFLAFLSRVTLLCLSKNIYYDIGSWQWHEQSWRLL